MSNTVAHVEGLGKEYHIGRKRETNKTLTEVMSDAFVAPFRRAGQLLRGQAHSARELEETIWALRDISFEIRQGEILGVIGRNGAGKSTLLKILSRITEPTVGFAELHGRAGSLLEVGTGFHPELTGRENIYLNGVILGMTRSDIDRRFDEIVAFSGVEQFLDTPVKHYSSGMYVRLAFSVAAHLEPEILIVDEVLSVGDANFQKKCLGKMDEFSHAGRTIFFVSHNLTAVENLCTRAIVLEKGRTTFAGSPKDCVEYYLRSSRTSGTDTPRHRSFVDLTTAPGRPARFRPHLKRMALYTADGNPLPGGLRIGDPLTVQVHFHLDYDTTTFQMGLAFETLRGERLFTAHTRFQPRMSKHLRAGNHVYVCEIPSVTFTGGEYRIRVAMALETGDVDVVEDALRFTVMPSDFYGTGDPPWEGKMVLAHTWRESLAAGEQMLLRSER